jgi:hypothetical protein
MRTVRDRVGLTSLILKIDDVDLDLFGEQNWAQAAQTSPEAWRSRNCIASPNSSGVLAPPSELGWVWPYRLDLAENYTVATCSSTHVFMHGRRRGPRKHFEAIITNVR